jgi:hypothetical protein
MPGELALASSRRWGPNPIAGRDMPGELALASSRRWGPNPIAGRAVKLPASCARLLRQAGTPTPPPAVL